MNSSIMYYSICSLIHKKCHPKNYHSDIKYHMTLNIIFSVACRWIQLDGRTEFQQGKDNFGQEITCLPSNSEFWGPWCTQTFPGMACIVAEKANKSPAERTAGLGMATVACGPRGGAWLILTPQGNKYGHYSLTPRTLHSVPNPSCWNIATSEHYNVGSLMCVGMAAWLQIPYWVYFIFKVKNSIYMCTSN